MKFFRISYKTGKKRGVTIIEAENRVEAIEKFFNMAIGVMTKIEEISEPLSWKLKKLLDKFKSPIKNRSVDTERYIAFLDQLAVMLNAGLPLDFALNEAISNEKNPMIKAIFTQIRDDIQGGKSLYDASKRFKKQLGTLSLAMFRLGEETGLLAQEIAHLSKILQEILDNRRKFKKATRYPIFIMVAMSIAFVIVTIMVIPQFEAFFKESKMELPLPTKFLLWLEHSIKDYGDYVLAGAIGVMGTISYLYGKSEKVRFLLDRLLLKIFIIGKATYYAMMSRFFYIFKVLQDAGVTMIDALNISLEIVDNVYLKRQLLRITRAIEEGRSLYQGFSETDLFENMIIEMIKAGEIGGGLSKMLEKITKIYKDRFDYIVDNIATLIEPILIAAIAGFVLTLALGIFLPMWNLVNIAG